MEILLLILICSWVARAYSYSKAMYSTVVVDATGVLRNNDGSSEHTEKKEPS